MSYCVNCGVELADSERRCPLCHTEVHNPRQPYDRKIPKPFPNRLDLFEPEDNRGFAAAITTLLLALPPPFVWPATWRIPGGPAGPCW